MKLHPIFGINALARVCICCGKVIGYTPLGNSVEEDASKSKQIAEAIIHCPLLFFILNALFIV
jgi:hypothetical protein